MCVIQYGAVLNAGKRRSLVFVLHAHVHSSNRILCAVFFSVYHSATFANCVVVSALLFLFWQRRECCGFPCTPINPVFCARKCIVVFFFFCRHRHLSHRFASIISRFCVCTIYSTLCSCNCNWFCCCCAKCALERSKEKNATENKPLFSATTTFHPDEWLIIKKEKEKKNFSDMHT